ncbi:ATP-binding protein [Streptomyces sp. NPDC051172]|uniref:ATP-binding protein n=1 Tax=Streptomyces sp. NPDC051172 TaxID=3155796 RepID=UPI00342C04B0
MRIPVKVMPDFLENVARRHDPLGAVEELIWNGLDADANDVSVDVELNEFDGVEAVVIKDNGHGIPGESVAAAFSGMGGSWKRGAAGTHSGRQLHGRHGYGRFRVLALGSTAQWTTVADGSAGHRERTAVRFTDGATDFEQDPQGATTEPAGTVVRVTGDAPRKNRLTKARVHDEMTCRFAIYLSKYPDVTVIWRGSPLNPLEAIEHQEQLPLTLDDEVDAAASQPQLRIVEWKIKPPKRELLICDANGVHRMTLSAGVQAPDFHFSAYLMWDKFANLTDHEMLEGEFEHSDSALGRAVTAAREQLRIYFRKREREITQDQVRRWIEEEIYPYSGEPASETEAAERETFDDVAVTVRRHLKGTKLSRRTQLTLLREALRRQPAAMPRILDELFHLTVSDRERLEALVHQTTLPHLISANALVVDRIDALALFKQLLFDPESRRGMREKDQLHRMLEKELWIFGDEYAEAVSETGLTDALNRHLAFLDGPTVPRSRRPVRRTDGRNGRLDLMLSGTIGAGSTKRHLVVELKRPSVRLGETEAGQVRSYARAVIKDDRFRHDEGTRWDFWLVGNEIDEDFAWTMDSNGLPPNCIHDDGRIRIWVYEWGQIIDACEQRLQRQRERLDYASSQRHLANYAERVHADADVVALLPPA